MTNEYQRLRKNLATFDRISNNHSTSGFGAATGIPFDYSYSSRSPSMEIRRKTPSIEKRSTTPTTIKK
jgi:hypothetical protein